MERKIKHYFLDVKRHFPIDLVFLCLLLGTVFVDLFPTSSYDAKRIILLLLGISLALLSVFDRRFTLMRIPLDIKCALSAFFFIGALSAATGPYPYWGAVDLINFLTLLGIFALLTVYFSRVGSKAILERCFTWIVLYTVLYFYEFLLGLYFTTLVGLPLNRLVAAIDFIHPRFFNQLQVILVPFLLVPFLLPSKEKLIWLARFCLVAHICVLIISGARGATLSLIVASVLLLPFFRSVDRKKLIFEVLLALIIAFGLSQLLIYLASSSAAVTEVQVKVDLSHTSGRLDHWLNALSSVLDKPLLGHSPFSSTWQESIAFGAHPHNISVQILFEYGVLAFMALLYVLLRFFSHALVQLRKTSDVEESGVLQLSLLSILAALVLSQFSGVLVMPFSQLFLMVVLSIFISRGIELDHIVNLKQKMTVSVAVVCVCVFILFFSQPLVTKATAFYPRIWLDGAL